MNYLPIVTASVVGMAVGFVWYSDWLFGKSWRKIMGKSEADIKKGNIGQTMLLAFVAALVEAYVLSMFIGFTNATTLAQGVQTAFWLWLGFVATTMWTNYAFGGKPTQLYIIDTLHHLAVLLVMGAVLATWV